MAGDAAVILSQRSAIDYCQPDLSTDNTRQAVQYIQGKSVQIDIRKSDWKSLTESLTDVLNLFIHLKDEATRILREYEDDQALEQFKKNVLTRESLTSHGSFSLNKEHIPEITELKESVSRMGIKNFRAYADDQIQHCTRGQERLDVIIHRKYSRGGESVGIFEAAVESKFGDDDAELLVTAFVWGNDVDGYLLSRHNSPVHSQRDIVYDCMASRRFDIISPDDLVD
ncbi:hypothetical protein [Halobacterium salinarum]|uniref:hypothetical protein n=1 Tax=Halobacterium salinarum TaxID=2242 RepID=UPI0025538328|nr:hypothetical protein [Halobacterium salinarum]MDL0121795.1 hypothetical protein [Halobacterium salinarum]